MASFTIREATPDDAEAIAKVHFAAYGPINTFYQCFFEFDFHESMPRNTRKVIREGTATYLVAIEPETNEIVGFCRHYIVEARQSQAEEDNYANTNKEAETNGGEAKSTAPSDSLQGNLFKVKDHLKEVFDKMNEPDDEQDVKYEQVADGKRHYYLRQVMVNPAHQRKGVGRKLVALVMEKCDREGLPAFLCSSKEAYSLYHQMGFEDLGKWRRVHSDWAKEILRIEESLGIKSVDGLLEASQGEEIETLMVRWPVRQQ